MDKLGVIVPYKNREEQLKIFTKHITEYLNTKGINFELIIVEQKDTRPFNRGKLLNIGFTEAVKLNCNYVVFHDVDMLPIEVDYSYSNKVLHLATDFISDNDYSKEIFDSYFGGVTLFPVEIFQKINGYSNEYWGWGFEDDDLLRRCIDNDIETNSIPFRNRLTNITALNFDGENSYIKIKNNINYSLPIKISATFKINMQLDDSKEYDEFTIFSIPGYDMTLSYNSFGRYKFEFWDYQKKVYSITSKITTTYLTNICIEINPTDCIVKMIQDGEYIGATTFNRKLLPYSKEPHFYIGNANPYRGENFKELHGYVSDFKIWNDASLLIDLDFKNYVSHNIYNKPSQETFDTYGCSKIEIKENKYTLFPTPIRRKSTFKLLEHENNGFENGKWKYPNTRLNQIKYFNNNIKDGLDSLEYRLLNNNKNHLEVLLYMKLGVCVPYRNREEHMNIFVPHITKFLEERGIEHTIYLAHQCDDKLFNRGLMKNIAAKHAFDDGCDYIVWHDIDMIPEDDSCDYSFPKDNPQHIAVSISQSDYQLKYEEYFGGAVLFSKEQVEKTNGYSNDYWDWGMEDDDLFWRCVMEGYAEKTKLDFNKEMYVANFNGINSKIELPVAREQKNCISNSHTISILVKADQQIEKVPIWLIGDEERQFVEYPIFRKPGYDWGLSFNNSRAYTMQLWDRTKQHLYQWIKRYENQWSWITMAVDSENKKIHFYLNGRESDARLGTGTQSPLEYFEPLKRYGSEPFYIGYCNSPKEEFFKGGIAQIQMWDRCLTPEEIKNIHLKMPEDNLILDIFTMNLEFGIMENIELTKEAIEIPNTILPYRRNGKFTCLPHETEGLINVGGVDKWAKGETTAKNERRYILQMQQNKIDYKLDGINNMKYTYINTDIVFQRHKLINVISE